MERRTNAASDQTKYALAVALKELMAQKPIDKITIHDLTERCGIRRQNFYYHFPTYTTSCAGCFRRRPRRCCSSTRGRSCGRRACCSCSAISSRTGRSACVR
ncbi:MAG: TetR family transcriptional regulator [Firmicutes bacterium]|nr:TetR family transcriptional regulator [Bacillota bacterium]